MMTLPFVVLALGVVFLVLGYAGVFQRAGERRKRSGRSRPKFPDEELERRLKVFERFLSREDPEDEGPGSERLG